MEPHYEAYSGGSTIEGYGITGFPYPSETVPSSPSTHQMSNLRTAMTPFVMFWHVQVRHVSHP